jgi:hypothetical protein
MLNPLLRNIYIVVMCRDNALTLKKGGSKMRKNGIFFITLLVTVFFLFMATNWVMAWPSKKCDGDLNYSITVQNASSHTIGVRSYLWNRCEKGDKVGGTIQSYKEIGPGTSHTFTWGKKYGGYKSYTFVETKLEKIDTRRVDAPLQKAEGNRLSSAEGGRTYITDDYLSKVK